jgi:hypothetical protein
VPGYDLYASFHRYDYQVKWHDTEEQPIRHVTIVDSRLSDGILGQQISGQVRNDGDVALNFVEIVTIGYTGDDERAAVSGGLASLDELQPGQASPFEVVFLDAVGAIEKYELLVQAQPVQ